MRDVECTQCRREIPEGPVRMAVWCAGDLYLCNYHHDQGWPEDVIERQRGQGLIANTAVLILIIVVLIVVLLAIGGNHMMGY